jgi:hypothetical protein
LIVYQQVCLLSCTLIQLWSFLVFVLEITRLSRRS